MKKAEANELPNKLSLFIWQSIKNYKLILLALTISLFCIDITFIWLHPYLIKNIIVSIDLFDIDTVKYALISYIFLWIGLLFLGFIEDITSLFSTKKIDLNIKRNLINYVNKHSISFFKETIEQVVITKINDISNGCVIIIKNLIISMMIFICTQVIVFVTMYRASHLLFYYSLGATIFYMLTIFLINKHTKNKILNLSSSQSEVLKKMSDELSNISEIKNFGNEKVEKLILRNSIKDVYAKTKELTFLKAKVKFIKDLSSMCLIFVNIFALFYLKVTQDMNVAIIILIIEMSVAMMLFNRNFADKLMEGIDMYNITQANLDVIVVPLSVQDKKNAIDLEKENVKLDGKIEFKCVDFSYKTTKKETNEEGEEVEKEIVEKEVFKCLSALIEPKTKVGLVGYSGSGKTTFINLILRHFDIDRGYIMFDDRYDIRDITQESLRKNISYIQQDTTLFSRTIRENIIYGKLDATDVEIMDVAQKSGCLDFIMDLPDKFDTMVGEDGVNLSAGQEKQIIIARSMLKNSPIIIFDDFLHGLDSITESKINEALDNLMIGKTAIIASHDLAPMQNIDKIFVFDEGEIIEQGTHAELIKKEYIDKNGEKTSGVYRKMWESQVEEFKNKNNTISKLENTVKTIFSDLFSKKQEEIEK